MTDTAGSRDADTTSPVNTGDIIDSILYRLELIRTNFPRVPKEVNRFLAEITLSRVTRSNDVDYWRRMEDDVAAFGNAAQQDHLTRGDIKEQTSQEVRETSLRIEPEASKPSYSDVGKMPTRTVKSWADESSSDEEDNQILEDLSFAIRGARDTNVIRIPDDFEQMWPLGFSVITKAAENNGFVVIRDKDLNFAKSGFAYSDAFVNDRQKVEKFVETKTSDECTNISTLKGLVYFLRIKPDDWLAKSSQYALAASYALHFLIKGESDEDKDLIARSLKHVDGGRFLISKRLQSLFRTGSSCPMAILAAVERIYKNIAKNHVLANDDELKLVVDHCFTSNAGIVKSFYRKVTKKEYKIVEEPNLKGKLMKQKKQILVHGLDPPKLYLGSEFLKDEENSRLRKYETRFPNEVQLVEAVCKQAAGNFLLPARAARLIVQAAYDCSDRISKMLKRRKEATRVRALALAGESKKITQTSWVIERNAVVSESTETIDDICDILDNFEGATLDSVLALIGSAE